MSKPFPPEPGLRVHGHFGEWLQGRMGADGPVVLVTMPCPALSVHVLEGHADGPPRPFNSLQLRPFLDALGLPKRTWPVLERDMPLGGGAGASTATLIALAKGLGFEGRPEDLAQACISVEGASDPLMMPNPDQLLWASRQGRVLQHLPQLPDCDILGGFWGAPERTDPADDAFEDISDLVEDWTRAAHDGDLRMIGALASESAARCSARRSDARDPTPELARVLGAYGHIRAHTGSARGLIFPPGGIPTHGAGLLEAAGLHSVIRFRPQSGKA